MTEFYDDSVTCAEINIFFFIFQPPRKRLCKKSPAKKQEYEYKGSFYTKEELAKCKSENHHKFYDDSVACAENADPEEELEKCPDCERKFVSYFR